MDARETRDRDQSEGCSAASAASDLQLLRRESEGSVNTPAAHNALNTVLPLARLCLACDELGPKAMKGKPLSAFRDYHISYTMLIEEDKRREAVHGIPSMFRR